MNPEKATRDSWKTQPIPELNTQLQLERTFTLKEYEHLSWGQIPQEMEDKWFTYLEDDWLYFHRSWTGFCIYQVSLKQIGDNYIVGEAWVNRDPE